MDNDYDIANEDGLDFPLGDDEVASCIDAVLAHEGVGRPCMVSVSVVSDERIREVNAEWRDVDAPTDVVSLECERPDDPDLAPASLASWGTSSWRRPTSPRRPPASAPRRLTSAACSWSTARSTSWAMTTS